MKAGKVRCSQCKKEKFTNPKALEARIKKFGSIEEIEKSWICKDCSKREVATPKEEVKGEIKKEETTEEAIKDEETKDAEEETDKEDDLILEPKLKQKGKKFFIAGPTGDFLN